MSTYREIHGKAIKSVSTDPSATTDEGQIWYNTTSESFKSIVNLEAWSSSAGLIYAQGECGGGAGTQTAALIAGGLIPEVATSGEYNGSGWTAGGNMNTAGAFRGLGGTQTAGFCFGNQVASPDYPTGVSETYNGTSWTSISTIPQVHSQSASFGSTTAGVCAAGRTDNGDNATTVTNEWDGSSWTTGGAYPAAIRLMGVTGTAPAPTGLAFGGQGGGSPSPGKVTTNNSYDGSSWTAQTAIPTATSDCSGAAGTSASALMMGGNAPSATANCFKYDGTSWTATPSLGTARRSAFGLGSTTAALCAGGSSAPGDNLSVTEEFNSSVNVITGAAWATGGSVSTVRTNVGSTSNGTQNAALVWGGRTGPPPSGPYTSNKCDEYNGSTFTATPNLNLAARTREGGGTTTAAWCAGGEVPTVQNACEEYDGSSWTSVTAAPLVFQGAGTGVQTAGLIAGLVSASPPTGSDAFPGISLEYDGTNWATGGSPGNDRNRGGCSGTQTAGTLISGYEAPPSPNARVTDIEEYNGTSWTSAGVVVTANAEINAGARGPQTATLITGGFQNPSPGAGSTQCSTYDGTATATTASMGTGRRGHGSDGGQTSGIVMTGQSAAPPVNSNPNYTANAEELTAETTAINVKTLTQS